MWYFCSPRKIVFGENALEGLREISGKKALIVTDKILVKLGLIQPVKDLLKEENIDVVVFDDVEPEPSIPIAQMGSKIALKEQIDLIIAVGGGSVIDAAKAIWVYYENPDMDIGNVFPEDPLPLRLKARFVAIPTTSGTGSDANWAIIITDPEAKQKLSLAHRDLIPDMDIVDPQFTTNLPLKLTVNTAFDALAHAIEGYTVEWRNDFSDGLAVKAIELIIDFLPKVVENTSDVLAREKLHNAATMAGLAFGNSQIGGAHAIAHSLGAILSLPHAEIITVVLPYMMEYCVEVKEVEKLYAEIAYHAKLSAKIDKEAALTLISKIKSMMKEYKIKTKLSDFGITKKQLDEKIELISDYALNDTGSLVNPRELSDEVIRKLCYDML